MDKRTGMAQHSSSVMQNDEWLTPPSIIEALGKFYLDPCSPQNRPWDTAMIHYTLEDNGLLQPWTRRVWLNPPYGKYTGEWMNKMAMHGDGIALIFARTDTGMFHESIFPHAHALFFLRGRIVFHHTSGKPGKFNGGAPSVLIAYGDYNAQVLKTCNLRGKFVSLKNN